MVREWAPDSHPTDEEMAAYLGHELDGEALREVELHLAGCIACRQEFLDATEILKPAPRLSWRVLAPVAAAAAVALLIFPWPRGEDAITTQPLHRDSPALESAAPGLVTPVGTTSEVSELIWTRVGGADQYRMTLFDSEGSVMWREMTADSSVAVPDSITFRPNHSYLWRVEARVGWDIWESSELLEFRVERESSTDTGSSRSEGSP